MSDVTRAPNVVPKGGIRLSDAFDCICSALDPDWKHLPDLCVMWDEHALYYDEDTDASADPYNRVFEVSSRAEAILRPALTRGDLRTYVHNTPTGVDLELRSAEWRRFGETAGFNSDYTSDAMPGPSSVVDGIEYPIFLDRKDFEVWLTTFMAVSGSGSMVDPETRAFSLEEVGRRTGLSRSKLYSEIEQKRLSVKKCGNRTLVLETALNSFLKNLPAI